MTPTCKNCKNANWHCNLWIKDFPNPIYCLPIPTDGCYSEQFDVVCSADGRCFLEEETPLDCDKFIADNVLRTSHWKACEWYNSIRHRLNKIYRFFIDVYCDGLDSVVSFPSFLDFIKEHDPKLIGEINKHND